MKITSPSTWSNGMRILVGLLGYIAGSAITLSSAENVVWSFIGLSAACIAAFNTGIIMERVR